MTVGQALAAAKELQDDAGVSAFFRGLADVKRRAGELVATAVADLARAQGWSERDATLAEGIALAIAYATLDVGAISQSASPQGPGSLELTTDEASILREALVWVVHRPLMPPESKWPTLTGFSPAEDQEVLDALCISLRTYTGRKLRLTEGDAVDVRSSNRERVPMTFLRHLTEPDDPPRPPRRLAEVIDSEGRKHVVSNLDVDFPQVERAAGRFADGTQWSLSSIFDPGFRLRWEFRSPAGEIRDSTYGTPALSGARGIQLMFGHAEGWKAYENILVAGQVTKDASSVTVHFDDGSELPADLIAAPELPSNLFVAVPTPPRRALWAEARDKSGTTIAHTPKPGSEPWPSRSASLEEWARWELRRLGGLVRAWQVERLYDWARPRVKTDRLSAREIYALATAEGWDERTATLAEGIVLAAQNGPGPFGVIATEPAPPERRTVVLTERQGEIARAALVNVLYGPYDLNESEFHTLTGYWPPDVQPVLDALELALGTDIGRRLSLRAGDPCTLRFDTGAEVPATFVRHVAGERLNSGASRHNVEIAYPDDRRETASLFSVAPRTALDKSV